MLFQVSTAVKMLIFWVVTLCGLGRYQHFGRTYCLHLHGLILSFTVSQGVSRQDICSHASVRLSEELDLHIWDKVVIHDLLQRNSEKKLPGFKGKVQSVRVQKIITSKRKIYKRSVSEDDTAPIFRADMKMEAVYSSETLVCTYKSIRRLNL
jgi:hypothetical protein